MPMSEEDLADFYKIKDKLINSEALASPYFSDLDKYPVDYGARLLNQGNVHNYLASPEMFGWTRKTLLKYNILSEGLYIFIVAV